MDTIPLLDTPVYAGTIMQWLTALGLTTVVVLSVQLAKPILVRRLTALSQRTRLAIDDAVVHALDSTRVWLVTIIAIEVGSHALDLPETAQKIIDGAATIALFLQIGLWLADLLKFWLDRSEQRARTASPGAATSLAAVGFVGRIVLWAVVFLLILDNLGVNITTLVAGLGIGGVAVALAVQNILGDLFASLSIVIDKPFVAGDFIILDNFMGTVEHIGLKTTRVRSLDGEQIIFSNSDLLKGRIKNYKRMHERRVVFPFRVRYDTTPEQLEQIPGIVQRLIEGEKQTRFERSHFHRFGESSFDFETVFWMTTPDYNVYMDAQQRINLALMREFDKRNIDFALPTKALVKTEDETVEEDADAQGGNGKPRARPQPPRPVNPS
jgi:small-conductance mechanosensitive channel